MKLKTIAFLSLLLLGTETYFITTTFAGCCGRSCRIAKKSTVKRTIRRGSCRSCR